MSAAIEAEYEALLQFLYLSPVALVQTRLDGDITMCNPLCAQLLMPLAANSELTNLFDALALVAPDLRHRVKNFTAPGSKPSKVMKGLFVVTTPHRGRSVHHQNRRNARRTRESPQEAPNLPAPHSGRLARQARQRPHRWSRSPSDRSTHRDIRILYLNSSLPPLPTSRVARPSPVLQADSRAVIRRGA